MRLSRSFKSWTVLAAVVVVGCLLVVLVQRSVVPSYQGKSLHSWLVLLQSTNLVVRELAETAVREIGADAVPTLTAWLSHRDSAAEKLLTQWLARAGLISHDTFSENYYRPKALCGFRTLGTNAQAAVPALRQFLEDPNLASDAGYALVWVAPREAERLAEKWIADTNRLVRVRGLKLKAEIHDR
jgi:hypothetical protein